MLKKIVSIFAAAVLSTGTVYAEYIDVTPDAWYNDSVTAASNAGWFSGYDDGTFLPNGTITRAEAIKVLLAYKFDTKIPLSQNSYEDVDKDAWYSNYVNLNTKLNIIPADNNRFRPEEKITREDAMYGLVQIIGLNTDNADISILDNFTDGNTVTENLKHSVASAVEAGLVGGYDDGTVKPDGSITRAEFATIMLRADKKAAKTPSPLETSAPSASPEATKSPQQTPSPLPALISITQKEGENLFNYKYTSGKLVSSSNGSDSDDTQYITSDYINVFPEVSYFCATYSPSSKTYTDTCTSYAYYDADKNFIFGDTKSMKTPVKTPVNAAYIKFSIKQTAEMTNHERLARYTVFSKTDSELNTFTYPSDENINNKFYGKKVYIYGNDSIKYGSDWINILEKNTGVQFNEVYTGLYFGSNSKNSLYDNSHINKISEDADYIFIYGGVQDWLYSLEIGDINGISSTTTTYGVSLLNRRLKERCKNAEIIYITPHLTAAFGRNNFSANGLKNELGYTVTEYADAIKEQAQADGLYVIDLNKGVNITADTINDYVNKNGNEQLYPNAEGRKLIGEYILNAITE